MSNISFIVIGKEILSGHIQDQLIKWLAKFLGSKHQKLNRVFLCPDDPKSICDSIRDASKDADIIITSGGLGPTKDDLTKKTLAEYFKRPLEFNQNVANQIKDAYRKFNKTVDEKTNHYSFFPKDFIHFFNKAGIAPGLGLFDTIEEKFYCSLPGVPIEFKNMFSQEIFPFLDEKFFKREQIHFEQLTVRTRGIPEESLFTKIAPSLWNDMEKWGSLSSLPIPLGIDLTLDIVGKNLDDVTNKKESVLKYLKNSPLNDYIWNIGDQSIEEVIVTKAKKLNLKFGFAESASGGLCASRITKIAGCSSVFQGSLITYQNELKSNLLKVDPRTIEQHTVVSIEVAKEMAIGALERLNSDICISITGIAGPTGELPNRPIGSVAIGTAAKNGDCFGELYQFSGDRELLQYRFSQMALYKLLEKLN